MYSRKSGSKVGLLLSVAALMLCLPNLSNAGLFGTSWKDIPEEELRMDKPEIDPDAPLEYLERRKEVDDNVEGYGSRVDNYIRFKIFTDLGVDEMSQVDIYYYNQATVRSFAARITYPDGSVEELDRDDLFDRDILRGEGIEVSVKSFSIPRLVPGTIVEYKWTERRKYIYSFNVLLEEEWPTHYYMLDVNPYDRMASVITCYNGAPNLKKKSGHFVLEQTNMPGIKIEPFQGPRTLYEPWAYFRYTEYSRETPEKYWDHRSKDLMKESRKDFKDRDRAVKAKAEELFAGVSDPMEKLRRAYEFCAREVRNVYGPYSPFTYGELEDYDENKSPSDTLEHNYGTPSDINKLFASLVAAGGFEARYGVVEDKTELRFDVGVLAHTNLIDQVIAVEMGEAWLVMDPGSLYLPFGRLNAENANAVAMVPQKKDYSFIKTGSLLADDSVINREAEFTLSDDGNLDGKVTITYTGYAAIWRKRKYDRMTDKYLEEKYMEAWKEQMPGAEFTNFSMKNDESFTEPLTVEFYVTYPNFGESLGSRIFFEPSFFERGNTNPFEEEERLTDITYSFPYTVKDTVWYDLPEGYQLEEATNPGKGLETGAIDYVCTIGTNKSQSKLRLMREFSIQVDQFPIKIYPQVKMIYDEITRQDAHSLSLKRAE